MSTTLARSRAFAVAALVTALGFIGIAAATSCGEPGLSAQSCIGKTVGC